MPFSTSLSSTPLDSYRGPLLIAVVSQGPLPSALAGLDDQLGGALGRVYSSGDFGGKRDETALVYPAATPGRVLLVGTGKEPSTAAIRRGAAVGAKRARILGAPSAALVCPTECRRTVSVPDTYQSLAEGAAQGAWHFPEMKRPPEDPKPAFELLEILTGGDDTALAGRGHSIGAAIGAGHRYARGLQVLPPNVLTPAVLADRARALAAEGGFGCTVLDRLPPRRKASAVCWRWGKGRPTRSASSSSNTRAAPARPWCSSGRASRSTPGAFQSSRPRAWRT